MGILDAPGISPKSARALVQRRVMPVSVSAPTTMTSPPTVTDTSTASLATFTSYAPTTGRMLVHGPALIDQGFGFYRPPTLSGGATAVNLTNSQPWELEFDFEGQFFDLQITNFTTAKYRMLVNGQDATGHRTIATPYAAAKYAVVNFGSRGTRRVKFQFEGAISVSVIRIEKTASILPAPRAGITGAVLGDSFVAGGTATARYGSLSYTLGAALGWGNVISTGADGTGYLKVSSDRPKLRDRVQADVIAQKPDAVVISGGYNDNGSFTPAAVGAEAELLYAQVKAGIPGVDLTVVGPWWSNGTPSAGILAMRDAIQAAAANVGVRFVDVLNPNIWTGTGNAGTPNGTGNSDFYVISDGTHPTQAGSEFIGRAIANLMSGAYPWGPLP